MPTSPTSRTPSRKGLPTWLPRRLRRCRLANTDLAGKDATPDGGRILHVTRDPGRSNLVNGRAGRKAALRRDAEQVGPGAVLGEDAHLAGVRIDDEVEVFERDLADEGRGPGGHDVRVAHHLPA